MVALVLVLAVGLILHKNLPRTAVVQITGTDVKRIDSSSKEATATQEGSKREKVVRTSDVRFINAVSRDGKVMVFKNEDTGWGWPPYFKFDSADLTAQAQAFSIDENKPWVRVRYYGWRIRIFSMFPNVVSLKEVEKEYTHFPIFNTVFIVLLAVLVFFLRRKSKQLIEWVRGLFKPRSSTAG